MFPPAQGLRLDIDAISQIFGSISIACWIGMFELRYWFDGVIPLLYRRDLRVMEADSSYSCVLASDY